MSPSVFFGLVEDDAELDWSGPPTTLIVPLPPREHPIWTLGQEAVTAAWGVSQAFAALRGMR